MGSRVWGGRSAAALAFLLASAAAGARADDAALDGMWIADGAVLLFGPGSGGPSRSVRRFSGTGESAGSVTVAGDRVTLHFPATTSMIARLEGRTGDGAPRTVHYTWRASPTEELRGPGGAFVRARVGTPDQVEATLAALGPSQEEASVRLARLLAAEAPPVTDLPREALPDFDRFRAEKALLMARLRRDPRSVREGFLPARGSVAGEPIAPRSLFWQRWAPQGATSGRVVAVFPGYKQTGRSWANRIQELTRRGDTVWVFDPQWAGYTRGSQPGEVDRGWGVVRDVAAALAWVSQAEPGQELVPFGYSLGGAGVIGALVLGDQGAIELEGPPLPRGLSGVVQNAFLAPTVNLPNRAMRAAGAWGMGAVQVPAHLLPPDSGDPAVRERARTTARAEDVRARAATFGRVAGDLEALRRAVAAGARPRGKLYFFHGDRDAVSDPATTLSLVQDLGDHGDWRAVPAGTHAEERVWAWRAIEEALGAAGALR